jgi:hypothetical protein
LIPEQKKGELHIDKGRERDDEREAREEKSGGKGG